MKWNRGPSLWSHTQPMGVWEMYRGDSGSAPEAQCPYCHVLYIDDWLIVKSTQQGAAFHSCQFSHKTLVFLGFRINQENIVLDSSQTIAFICVLVASAQARVGGVQGESHRGELGSSCWLRSYQLPGIVGSPPDTETFPSFSKRASCGGSDGQHYSGGVHK